jgi:hypothetical protein
MRGKELCVHKDDDLENKTLTAGQPLTIAPPKIDPQWPWVLEEITQRKSDGQILKHTATGMTTAQVNKIRINYASGKDHFDFRRGKPMQLEFEDATTTLKLTRQGPSRGHLKVVNMKETIEGAVKNAIGKENENNKT